MRPDPASRVSVSSRRRRRPEPTTARSSSSRFRRMLELAVPRRALPGEARGYRIAQGFGFLPQRGDDVRRRWLGCVVPEFVWVTRIVVVLLETVGVMNEQAEPRPHAAVRGLGGA